MIAGFYCGQRMGDLICLSWGGVDFGENVIRFAQAKTRKTAIVPMRPALRRMLKSVLATAGNARPDNFIWPEQAERYEQRGAGPFSNEFYEILAASGLVPARSHKPKGAEGNRRGPRKVTPVSFHCLRHTFISQIKITGGSQAVAKELAGHSSDAISDLYTHTDPDVLAKAIAALPDLAA